MMSSIRFTGIALLISLLLISFSYPQEKHFRFSHITTEQGLSQNSVNTIYQDKEGFMWFGTQGGLNRYDGYNFLVFKNSVNNPSSISDNTVNCIYEDNEGYLWIGTPTGLNKLDKKSGNFQRFTKNSSGNIKISSDEIYAITGDDDDNIWIATYAGGLNKYNFKRKKTEVFFNTPKDEASGRSNIMSICYDKNDNVLWIGTLGGGLLRYDIKNNTYKTYLSTKDPASISENVIYSLFCDTSGDIWIGTQNGSINRFDKKQQNFVRYPSTGSGKAGELQQVFSICKESQGVVWAALAGGGIRYLLPGAKEFITVLNDPKDPNSLCSNQVSYLFVDHNDGLWVGTNGVSLDYYSKHKNIFQHHQKKPFDNTSLSDNSIWSIVENTDGTLFVGTNEGINELNAKRQRSGVYSISSKQGRINNNMVFSLCFTAPDQLWAGTQAGGINIIDTKRKKASYLISNPNNPTTVSSNYIKAIFRDSKGTIWVGTDRGLNEFHSATSTFSRYQNNPDDAGTIGCDDISCIAEDNNGTLWVATYGGGISSIDPGTKKIRSYLFKETSSAVNKILTIWVDRQNFLWLGTEGNGIKKFNPQTGTLVDFPFCKEFENLNVYGILGDGHNNLWLSTFNGLIKFNPGEKIRKIFKTGDGLQGNDFNLGSYCKGSSGKLYFGGPNGFNEFNPDSLTENTFVPPVRFTMIKVLDKEMDFSSIKSDSTIVLQYNQNTMSFEFTALDFTSSQQNEYAYIMDGLDSKWQHSGNRRFANYSNLAPGEYVFRVRGSNNDLVWNEYGASLKIIIKPPYWSTWWFRLLSVIVIVLSVYMAYRQRINALNKKHAIQLEQERIKQELNQARDMQQGLLPQTLPKSDRFEVFAVCLPTFEMGGDFYDVFWFDKSNEKLVVVTADVSGKAMKAAIMVVLTSGMLTQLRKLGFTTPSDALTQLNLAILEKKPEKRMFTAASLNFIDFKNMSMTFSNAGQPEPVLYREGKTEFLESVDPRLPLGQMSLVKYKHKEVGLQCNDILLFVSDAFPESVDPSGQQYGYERMFDVMKAKNDWGAEELGNALLADLKAFISTAPQYDDTTIVVVKVN